MADFEVLRCIGRGSYGEVFLARNVTGAYRAIKVVRREDFELVKTFEREFEGIKNYIDVSQGHPGLVNVFHVGRSYEEGYYYYVMDLADDIEGEAFDAQTADEMESTWWKRYEARTLSSDLRGKSCRPIRETVSVGKMLLGALGHLHSEGLTHRDVKPSNIIFQKGDPRLADVGLVARRGQRTFVGTEGYLPPEGPGTYAADLYAVAMVLYEMHTGKDRLDFPELPTNIELPRTVNRDEWRSLNSVVCRAGSPDPTKRFPNAETFAMALGEVIGDVPPKRGGPIALFSGIGMIVTSLIIFGLAAMLVWGPRLTDSSEKGLLAVVEPVEVGDAPIAVTAPPADPPVPEDFSDLSGGSNVGLDTLGGKGAPGARPFFDLFGPEEPPGPLTNSDNPPEVETEDPDAMVVGNGDSEVPAEPKAGRIRIPSSPPGAGVYREGKEIGLTDAFIELPPGEVELTVQMTGFRAHKVRWNIKPGEPEILPRIQLLRDRRPVEGQSWVNAAEIEFRPIGNTHISMEYVPSALLEAYANDRRRPLAIVDGEIAIRDDAERWDFCDWLTLADREKGFLDDKQYLAPQPSPDAEGEFSLRVQDGFGTVAISSDPAGAAIYRAGRYVGATPYSGEWRAGVNRFELRKSGFAVGEHSETVGEGQLVAVAYPLERDGSLIFGQPWKNSLGIPLVPIREGLMAAVWEVRVQDFEAFWEASGESKRYFEAPWEQEPNDPVVRVSRVQAEAFCVWLTKQEQERRRIDQTLEYRLPTDLEWSQMAGLDSESEDSNPMRRDGQMKEHFPWGDGMWPPPPNTGNFADAGSRAENAVSIIPDYVDGYRYTAPVGIYQPNRYGLYDMAGNVAEWVSDPYHPGSREGTLRGGHFDDFRREYLLTSYRNVQLAESGDVLLGFRIVLSKK